MGSRSVSPPTGDVYVLVEGRVLLHTLIQSSTRTQGLPSPEVAPEFGMTTKLQPALWRREWRVLKALLNGAHLSDELLSKLMIDDSSALLLLQITRET